MYDVAFLEAGAVRALDLVHHVPGDLRVKRPLQHHLRLGVPRVDGEVVEPPILKISIWFKTECHQISTGWPILSRFKDNLLLTLK